MTAQAEGQKQQYVKVMYRFTDPKRRQEIAREFERRHGKPTDPDAFNMTVAFPIDHFGSRVRLKKPSNISLMRSLCISMPMSGASMAGGMVNQLRTYNSRPVRPLGFSRQ